MKKTVTFVFKLLFTLLLLGWSSNVSAYSGGGDGSVGNPYQIGTLADLAYLSDPLNSADWDKYFIQTANIDASATSGWDGGQGFLPIATFTGSYDGQGHTISGLFIDRPTMDYVGMFGATAPGIDPLVGPGIVKNLGLLSVNITGEFWVGALGGDVASSDNCYSTGTVNGASVVGGLWGSIVTGNSCFSTCTVNGSGDYVGGLGGWNNSLIYNCYASGNVTGAGSVGGLFGQNNLQVYSSYFAGVVSGTSLYGGLVGENLGGVTDCFWDKTKFPTDNGVGLGKTTAEMKIIGTYLDASLTTQWDFTKASNIWAYNGDYPFLRYETTKTPGFIWLSTASTDWAVAGNWSENAVPASGKNVYIPKESAVPSFEITAPVLNTASQAVANLTIESGGKLTIASGGQLSVAGSLTNSTGTNGLIINSGGSLSESTAGVPATVESAIVGFEWHLISAPVSNATAMMFTGKYLQELTESTNTYTDVTSDATPLTPMKGFALYGDAGYTIEYAGLLNTADQSFNYTAANQGYNLVGNPYPSSIDWNLVTKPGSLNNATYRHVNAATWATYIAGVGNPVGTERFIAPGQGFLVKATGSGTLAITTAAKAHHATQFYKTSDEVINNLVRLKVSGNGYSDEAVVRFLSDATAEFDGKYDAHKLFGDVPEAAQIYTLGSIPLAINALPETSSVPVGIHAETSGSYTLSALELKDLKYVTLEDTKTGVFTDLSVKPYTFNFTAGENEQRFVLHFSALSVKENESTVGNIYSNNQTVYINLKDQVKGDIFIYDISGKLITSKVSVQGMSEIGLSETGNYIVKVITRDNTLVKKVFIK